MPLGAEPPSDIALRVLQPLIQQDVEVHAPGRWGGIGKLNEPCRVGTEACRPRRTALAWSKPAQSPSRLDTWIALAIVTVSAELSQAAAAMHETSRLRGLSCGGMGWGWGRPSWES